tara:strand:+ start:766 stop:1272 length:507 start_codon:yes stop_codon:yes gene_type:complete
VQQIANYFSTRLLTLLIYLKTLHGTAETGVAMSSIEEILLRTKTIAVVGLSDNPTRSSYGVAQYLQKQGYRIIPVNPKLTHKVLGEQVYGTLQEIREPIDLVDIFRRSVDVPPIVDAAIAIGVSAIWMQLGITNMEAAEKAHQAGIDVIMDKCTAIEHRFLNIGPINT